MFIILTDDADLEMSDTSDDTDDDDSVCNSPSYSNDQLIHTSLLTLQSTESLGNWEKHTRGIGSKLMIQMGYVIGTGLGKRSDGRIKPVEATVLPPGKSLGLFYLNPPIALSCNALLIYFIFQIIAWNYVNSPVVTKICSLQNVKCVSSNKNWSNKEKDNIKEKKRKRIEMCLILSIKH